MELAHGPGAAGVRLEHPLDERCAVRVDGDRTDFAAVNLDASVEVAERGESGRTAGLGFLTHTFLRLHCEIGGVELGDGRHDPVQQLARGRLVDVLGRGHELCPGLTDGDVDGHVVFTGPGEPVHLVHDDVGNRPQFVNELEHGLQVRAVSGLGGLASIDELGQDDRAESIGSALIGFALCWDGVALGIEVGVGLGRCRDAEVADGELDAVREGLREVESLKRVGEESHSVASLRWMGRDERVQDRLLSGDREGRKAHPIGWLSYSTLRMSTTL